MRGAASNPVPVAGTSRDEGPVVPEAALADDLAVAIYEHMVVARAIDERMVALQREGIVASHSSAIGEEAAVVGAAAAMHDDDWIFPSSREIGAALWRGMPLAAYAHQVLGTCRDAGKGHNAPGPAFWKAARIVSASPLVGTQITHAVGVAWAAKMRKADVAVLAFFGEGATSTGDFHTGLNFAGVTRAPLVALCRNNGAAVSTPAARQTASDGFAVKAVAYGLRGVRVDGTDVVAVVNAVCAARARAAAGHGGTLVEAVLMGDDRADPIARARAQLEARSLWDEEREQRLAAEVSADVDRAVAEARDAAPPARASIFDDVYAEPPWHLREQRDAR